MKTLILALIFSLITLIPNNTPQHAVEDYPFIRKVSYLESRWNIFDWLLHYNEFGQYNYTAMFGNNVYGHKAPIFQESENAMCAICHEKEIPYDYTNFTEEEKNIGFFYHMKQVNRPFIIEIYNYTGTPEATGYDTDVVLVLKIDDSWCHIYNPISQSFMRISHYELYGMWTGTAIVIYKTQEEYLKYMYVQ